MILTLPFSIDRIATLFTLSCEIVDCVFELVLINYFHLIQLLRALSRKSSKQWKHYKIL